MARDWEATFLEWTKPSSDTEATKSENAERMIREAIAASPKLGKKTIKIFTQGSYRNNTNVRQESDVDVCVLSMDYSISDFRFTPTLNKAAVGLVDVEDYSYAQFRNEVEEALVAKFGRSGVTRGNKAFDVHANSYRVDADVVSCFEHRQYYIGTDGKPKYDSGTHLYPDKGGEIVNWPEQHYARGVAKNDRTSRRFKWCVRVLKRLKNEMAEAGIGAAKPIPSYLAECIVYNAPDAAFASSKYYDNIRYILAHAWNETQTDDKCKDWVEVNELKYLLRGGQPWTRAQVHDFAQAAWDYVGYK